MLLPYSFAWTLCGLSIFYPRSHYLNILTSLVFFFVYGSSIFLGSDFESYQLICSNNLVLADWGSLYSLGSYMVNLSLLDCLSYRVLYLFLISLLIFYISTRHYFPLLFSSLYFLILYVPSFGLLKEALSLTLLLLFLTTQVSWCSALGFREPSKFIADFRYVILFAAFFAHIPSFCFALFFYISLSLFNKLLTKKSASILLFYSALRLRAYRLMHSIPYIIPVLFILFLVFVVFYARFSTSIATYQSLSFGASFFGFAERLIISLLVCCAPFYHEKKFYIIASILIVLMYGFSILFGYQILATRGTSLVVFLLLLFALARSSSLKTKFSFALFVFLPAMLSFNIVYSNEHLKYFPYHSIFLLS